jgi:hypothetical protein
MELVLMGVLFFALMAESGSAWFIVPGGMIMGNGFILAYCALTGRWEDWAYFWPLEPLLVAASIIAPFLTQKLRDGGTRFVRRLAIVTLVLAGILFFYSLVTAIILS